MNATRVPRASLLLAGLALFVAACSGPGAGSARPASPVASAGPMLSHEAMASSSPLSSAAASAVGSAAPSDPLGALTLTDVRDGGQFTIGELAAAGPVLLETMAIWCTNCRAQMHRVVDAHTVADFTSVGLDVDPTEVPGDLKTYIEGEGFDWRFATADAQIATMLRERFGSQVLNPPSTPMILFFPDGSVRALDFGRPGGYSAEELVAEIAAG